MFCLPMEEVTLVLSFDKAQDGLFSQTLQEYISAFNIRTHKHTEGSVCVYFKVRGCFELSI